MLEACLQDAKQASPTGDGEQHAAQLPQHLMPAFLRDAPLLA
jgi:hypothetical protein